MYERIHLDDMATPKAYEALGETHGLNLEEFINLTPNIEMHYGAVRCEDHFAPREPCIVETSCSKYILPLRPVRQS